MRRLICLFFILFLVSFALAQKITLNPSSIQEMTSIVTIKGSGSFSGIVTNQDEIELKVLTYTSSEFQIVEGIEEKLFIGSETILPFGYEQSQTNKYVIFKINNLPKYLSDFTFRYEIKARIITKAKINLGNDYNLAKKIDSQKEFLAATENIEVNDQELISKADIEFKSDSLLESLRQIVEWTNSNLTYDFANYYNIVATAKQTYQSRRGVCDEFSNLAAAFLRIKGIPTRYNVGLSFDGEIFGNHGWLEIWNPASQKWIALDATYNEAGYVDATHITLAKVTDISEASDKIKITSLNDIDVQVNKELPEVNIISKKFFVGLIDETVVVPEELLLGENFLVKVNVKNRLSSKIIIPIKIALHEDFKNEKEEKLILLEPNESKVIEWHVTSPVIGEEGRYFIYILVFESPQGSKDYNIAVKYGFPNQEKKSQVIIEDVSPFISGTDLKIEITLYNQGSLDGTAEIKINSNNKIIYVPAFERKKFSYILKEIKPNSTVKIDILSDESKSVIISIPKDINQKVISQEIPVVANGLPTDVVNQPQINTNNPDLSQQPAQSNPESVQSDNFFDGLIKAIMNFFKSIFGS